VEIRIWSWELGLIFETKYYTGLGSGSSKFGVMKYMMDD
jgi:hypothetical protein